MMRAVVFRSAEPVHRGAAVSPSSLVTKKAVTTRKRKRMTISSTDLDVEISDKPGPTHVVVFPYPFGGIDRHLHFTSQVKMQAAVAYLVAGCAEGGHRHNIAVQMDDGNLWMTESALECVQLALGDSIA